MLSLLFVLLFKSTFGGNQPYNILFVVSDDLRADLGGYYGQNDIIYTPNIDSFQNRAFTFTHAYTQQALCGPTRASFLTGTRPDTTRVWNIGPYFRDRMINGSGKNVITMPQYFKDYANYYTVGAGKIFHPGTSSGGTSSECDMGGDMPYSWSQPYWHCDGSGTAEVASPAQAACVNGSGCTQSQACLDCFQKWNCYDDTNTKVALVCPADCHDDCFPDTDVATQTLKYFAQVTTNGTEQPSTPFFIAAGLKRPHDGFFAPIRYYQQYGYDINYSDIAIAEHTTIPKNAPIKATNNASAIANGFPDVKPYRYYVNYTDPPSGKNYTLMYVNTSYHNNLRAGYYASVAFMDAQFGRIIQGLYEYNLWDNTVIVFTGDHGWHLGEQGCWAKFTNFEVSVRVPLIIRVPGINEGKSSDILVEQLDIFPTFIDASGVGFKNESNITKQLEGKSLFNIIKNPSFYKNYYAYSQYPRGGQKPNFDVMGISMRTSQWRYTEWLGWNAGTNFSKPYPLWNVSYGIELYNHSNKTIDENDMNGYDNYNLAYDDEMKSIVNQLHNELYKTWDNQSWAINHKYN